MAASLKIHEAAHLMPAMTDEEYADLVTSMRKSGQLETIKLLGGRILDGRNRYRACKKLRIEPLTVELPEDTDPAEYVLGMNWDRRQLNKSQRGMVMAKWSFIAEAAGEKTDKVVDQAAERAGVGTRTIQGLRRIVKFGSDELIRLVDQGDVVAKVAEQLIASSKLSNEERLKAIDGGAEAIQAAIELADARALEAAKPGSAKERQAKPEAKKTSEEAIVDSTFGTLPISTQEAAQEEEDEVEAPALNKSDPVLPVQEQKPVQQSIRVTSSDLMSQFVHIVNSMSQTERLTARKYLDAQIVKVAAQTSLIPFDAKNIALKAKLDCDEFKSVWHRWCDYQAEQFNPLNEVEANRQIDLLKHKSLQMAIACIEVAMDKGDQQLASNVKAKTNGSFIPPTKAQVQAYIDEKQLNVDAGKFIGYYASQGWRKSNGQYLVDWKAGVRNWHDSGGSRSSLPPGRSNGYADDPAMHNPNREKGPGYGKL